MIPNYKEAVLEEYDNGASDAEVIRTLQVTRSQFESMLRTDHEFQQVVEYGRDLSKAFWYRCGRENLANNKFNTALWYANMKNRFGWSDRITNEERTPVSEKSEDELLAELQDKMAKHEKFNNAKRLRAA